MGFFSSLFAPVVPEAPVEPDEKTLQLEQHIKYMLRNVATAVTQAIDMGISVSAINGNIRSKGQIMVTNDGILFSRPDDGGWRHKVRWYTDNRVEISLYHPVHGSQNFASALEAAQHEVYRKNIESELFAQLTAVDRCVWGLIAQKQSERDQEKQKLTYAVYDLLDWMQQEEFPEGQTAIVGDFSFTPIQKNESKLVKRCGDLNLMLCVTKDSKILTMFRESDGQTIHQYDLDEIYGDDELVTILGAQFVIPAIEQLFKPAHAAAEEKKECARTEARSALIACLKNT